MPIGGSLTLIAVGAVLRWAVTAHVKGFDLQTAGLVLLIVGVIGLLFALLYTFAWSSSRRTEYVDPDAPPSRPPTYYR